MEKEESLQDMRSTENTLNNKISALENQLTSLNAQLDTATQDNGAKQQAYNKLNTDHSNITKQLQTTQESHSKVTKEVRYRCGTSFFIMI